LSLNIRRLLEQSAIWGEAGIDIVIGAMARRNPTIGALEQIFHESCKTVNPLVKYSTLPVLE
jgi:hypothetical protein